MNKFNFHGGIFAASLVLVAAVIIAELVTPFKNLLASIFSHHWIGKLVLTIITFIIFGFYHKKNKLFNKPIEKISYNTTLICLGIIFLFFILHYYL